MLKYLTVVSNFPVRCFQATKELKEAFKSPEAIPALFQLVVSSANPQIRQSAAVLLRKKLSKRTQWNKVAIEIRTA